MTKRLTTVDEYLEKHAAGKFPSPGLFEGLINIVKRRPIVSAATGLGIGGLGTLGILHAAGGDAPGATLSYRVNRALHSLTDRIRADEQFGEAFAKQLGSSSANELIGLTKDVVTKSYETAKDTLATSPARSALFDALRREDPDLAATDKGTLMEAYHTMTRFAPTLSTDKNAVKSFLRTVATSPEGGTDFNTIKLLAEAENAIAGPVVKKGG